MPAASSSPSDRTVAVQGLFLQYHLVLRSFVYGLVPDFTEAQDVLQETFLTVTAKAHEFTPGSDFVSWACTIARFKILESLRRRKLKILSEAAVQSLCAAATNLQHDPRLEFVGRCVEELAPQARRIVGLRYEGAHNPTEIAGIIGWTVRAVSVALSRARRALRDCINRKLATEAAGGRS
jgi:RNA polymerase sigma-70 factor, ECF subfamily